MAQIGHKFNYIYNACDADMYFSAPLGYVLNSLYPFENVRHSRRVNRIEKLNSSPDGDQLEAPEPLDIDNATSLACRWQASSSSEPAHLPHFHSPWPPYRLATSNFIGVWPEMPQKVISVSIYICSTSHYIYC